MKLLGKEKPSQSSKVWIFVLIFCLSRVLEIRFKKKPNAAVNENVSHQEWLPQMSNDSDEMLIQLNEYEAVLYQHIYGYETL